MKKSDFHFSITFPLITNKKSFGPQSNHEFSIYPPTNFDENAWLDHASVWSNVRRWPTHVAMFILFCAHYRAKCFGTLSSTWYCFHFELRQRPRQKTSLKRIHKISFRPYPNLTFKFQVPWWYSIWTQNTENRIGVGRKRQLEVRSFTLCSHVIACDLLERMECNRSEKKRKKPFFFGIVLKKRAIENQKE